MLKLFTIGYYYAEISDVWVTKLIDSRWTWKTGSTLVSFSFCKQLQTNPVKKWRAAFGGYAPCSRSASLAESVSSSSLLTVEAGCWPRFRKSREQNTIGRPVVLKCFHRHWGVSNLHSKLPMRNLFLLLHLIRPLALYTRLSVGCEWIMQQYIGVFRNLPGFRCWSNWGRSHRRPGSVAWLRLRKSERNNCSRTSFTRIQGVSTECQ